MSKLYEKMVAESNRIGWPEAFVEDLTFHDREMVEAMQPGEEAIWIVRENGTFLERMYQGICPEGVEYYAPQPVRCEFYHLKNHRVPEVRKVAAAEAVRLIRRPPTPTADGWLYQPVLDGMAFWVVGWLPVFTDVALLRHALDISLYKATRKGFSPDSVQWRAGKVEKRLTSVYDLKRNVQWGHPQPVFALDEALVA